MARAKHGWNDRCDDSVAVPEPGNKVLEGRFRQDAWNFRGIAAIVDSPQRMLVRTLRLTGDYPMDWRPFFMNPAVVWVLIPLSYIVITGIQTLCRQYYEHLERLAMIQQGIIPPARPLDEPAD